MSGDEFKVKPPKTGYGRDGLDIKMLPHKKKLSLQRRREVEERTTMLLNKKKVNVISNIQHADKRREKSNL